MAHPDSSPGKIKGRGTKNRKTRVIKRETYSRRDFKGYCPLENKSIQHSDFNKSHCDLMFRFYIQIFNFNFNHEIYDNYYSRIQKWRGDL